MNLLMSDGGVFRTTPATPGLLNTADKYFPNIWNTKSIVSVKSQYFSFIVELQKEKTNLSCFFL